MEVNMCGWTFIQNNRQWYCGSGQCNEQTGKYETRGGIHKKLPYKNCQFVYSVIYFRNKINVRPHTLAKSSDVGLQHNTAISSTATEDLEGSQSRPDQTRLDQYMNLFTKMGVTAFL